MNPLTLLVEKHKQKGCGGIYSICSAHPLVIKAGLQFAMKKGTSVLVEATSNQVNQYGGYTGMTPLDFKLLVFSIADDLGFPRDNIILGGDHLGPNCWQKLESEEAMSKSETLINDYVAAGFNKIHLDCSMSCADDPLVLNDQIVSKRAARLCKVAEKAAEKLAGEPPVYVIGTEVPVPGGATESIEGLELTTALDVSKTLEVHKKAFLGNGLTKAWDRVIGLVVQPGVEFDHHSVIDYNSSKANELSRFIENERNVIYEAHSTDYQLAENLTSLVTDHFAILKVGPELTFALREAIWALDAIEQEWVAADKTSQIKQCILNAMQNNPNYWKNYYSASKEQSNFECQYSLSDRIRYYWSNENVCLAYKNMEANLNRNPPPLTLISQFLPDVYWAIRKGEVSLNVESIIMYKIDLVFNKYYQACKSNV